jgi:hypothetical protein
MAVCNAGSLPLFLAIILIGCAQRHPITVETVEPWQRNYEQSIEQQMYASPQPTPPHGHPAEAAAVSQLPQPMALVSDVIAFPFRGLGWLVQVIF